jgi:hypothetical protein
MGIVRRMLQLAAACMITFAGTTFASALEDTSGDRTACMRALTRARRLYNL